MRKYCLMGGREEVHLITQISGRTNIWAFEICKTLPLALASGGWVVFLCTSVAPRWLARFVPDAVQLHSSQQLQLFQSFKYAAVFNFKHPTMAQFSSQKWMPLSKDLRGLRGAAGGGSHREQEKQRLAALLLASPISACLKLNDGSEGWNKACWDKYDFYFLHMRKGTLPCSQWCDSLWQKKTHQATACLLVWWLRCCPPPSLPYFTPEPTWQTLSWSILKLFLVSFWYQPQGNGITKAKAVWYVALTAMPSLVAPKSGAECASSLIYKFSLLLPKRVSVFVPEWKRKRQTPNQTNKPKKIRGKKKKGSKC